jgi:exonuclease SbcD
MTRYAGSLLQLDFGEIDQDKSVVVADLSPGLPPQIETVPVTRGRRLLDVTGTLDELHVQTIDPDAYLRVTVRCDGPTPGLADDVRALLPNALRVTLDYERDPGDTMPVTGERLEPREQFARYFQDRHGAPADERLLKLFDELLEEVSGAAA